MFRAGLEVVRAGPGAVRARLDYHRSISLPMGRDQKADIGHVEGVGYENVCDWARSGQGRPGVGQGQPGVGQGQPGGSQGQP